MRGNIAPDGSLKGCGRHAPASSIDIHLKEYS